MQRLFLSFIFACCAGIISAQHIDSLSEARTDTFKSLRLKEVEVLAQRRKGDATTSYLLNRLALDHHQMLNLSGIATLLPGGKTVNPTLTDDSRLGLRSSSLERGNATFGTAIEIDGMRLDNNGMMDETLGASTRGVSSSNIESVEVITGIPSVEYGDISNGVVKVNTRRGHSPFIFEASTNPYTKQVSLNKGFTIYSNSRKFESSKVRNLGTLNFSLEHAQSYTSITSPHTSYQRNALSLSYARALTAGASTFNIKASATGNIGGYNSETDPDAFAETYQKVRDNQFRANLALTWISPLQVPPSGGRMGDMQLRIDLSAAFSTTDRLTENYVNKSSASAQPQLHTMEDGYYIAQDFPPLGGNEGMGGEIAPPARGETEGGFYLGPTGYWYERSFHDQKPQSLQLKWKGSLTSKNNNLLIGAEYKSSRNNGRGLYYEVLSLAPTWRPYRYDELPAMENFSIFAEDRLTIKRLQLTAGLREEIAPKAVLSPRLNAKYTFPSSPRSGGLRGAIHAGYGKSVKLPSFQILYPADSYLDKLAFTPGSTADNKAFYAYNTYVSKAMRNPDLKWQYTKQFDLGAEAEWRGARLSVSFFWHKTFHPYQQVNVYTPVSYRYTSQAALEGISIPSADRIYSIDKESGVVSVQSASSGESIELPYTTHYTYNYNRKFINGSPVTRYGMEWILDLPKLYFGTPPARGEKEGGCASITLRLDGNYYHYKGLDRTLFAGMPNGVGDISIPSPQSGGVGGGLPFIGYYLGSNATSASSIATPSVSSGTLSEQCNLNSTVTLHIPRIRFIATLRLEASLLNYKRQLANDDAPVGHPLYYSTWDNPDQLLPFDPAAAPELIKLTPTDYYFDAQRISPYYSANISLTKEIGKWLSISFYANNFLNSMQHVRNSQTGLQQSLFNGGLIPKFYYGMSVRLKI